MIYVYGVFVDTGEDIVLKWVHPRYGDFFSKGEYNGFETLRTAVPVLPARGEYQVYVSVDGGKFYASKSATWYFDYNGTLFHFALLHLCLIICSIDQCLGWPCDICAQYGNCAFADFGKGKGVCRKNWQLAGDQFVSFYFIITIIIIDKSKDPVKNPGGTCNSMGFESKVFALNNPWSLVYNKTTNEITTMVRFLVNFASLSRTTTISDTVSILSLLMICLL